MGILDTSVAWIRSFTTPRTAPTSGSQDWPTKPADNLMRSTNDADDLQFMRRYVADGKPARTKPVPSGASENTPSPADAAFKAMWDRRSAQHTQYPRTANNVTNYAGDAPDRGRDMGYGLQTDATGTTPDRPGSTFGLRPAAPAGNARPDVDK
jgi:hypothetical protein